MKTQCITLSLLLFHFMVVAQSAELEKRNGYKDIKLGSHIDSVKECSFKQEITNKEGQVLKVYETKHSDYLKIGEVKVDEVELTTYNGLIYSIKVTAEKDPRLMKGMEMALGKAEWDVRNDQYFWKATSLLLTFKSIEKNKVDLTYTSYPIVQKMKNDLKKKVEEIADDF
ncbi:MAG: hypothetical protein O9302_09150 [Cyclobacteriaceae bacterium]|jgi:hypothetical protein|nr:hypothetical protein [Cytophagales bacterium]MCZ8328212.1 hypothetical protein [Cyclobacteriaceae bacterium]